MDDDLFATDGLAVSVLSSPGGIMLIVGVAFTICLLVSSFYRLDTRGRGHEHRSTAVRALRLLSHHHPNHSPSTHVERLREEMQHVCAAV